MDSSTFSRSLFFLVAGLLAPVFLTQCKTTASSYKDVSYDPAKLKTPAGHGLERNDYPFDESGAYRKDWVKNNSKGRDSSASPRMETTTAVAATDTAAPASTPASTSYPTYAEAAAARASGDFVGPTGVAAGSAATLASASEMPAGTGGVELASAGITSTAVASEARPTPASPSYHKVNSGDTLFALASKYNTSVPALKRVNGLSGDSIRAGQSLRIP